MVRIKHPVVFGLVALATAFEIGRFAYLYPEPTPDPTIFQGPFKHWQGHAYTGFVRIPGAKADRPENRDRSTLQIYEDGQPLGPQHTSSDDLAREGHGLYLFWRDAISGSDVVIFSTRDNSDPNTNGRIYRVVDPQARDPYESARTVQHSSIVASQLMGAVDVSAKLPAPAVP